MTADIEGDYAPADYVEERDAIVRANGGNGRISVVSLLPNAPSGVWSQVSNVLRELPSPSRFLLYLFGELAVGRPEATLGPPISLDGFLGSAGSYQSPWLLLVAAGIWTPSPVSVRRSIRCFAESCGYWNRGQTLALDPGRLPKPDDLKGFVPHGKIPNRPVVDLFLKGVEETLFQPPRLEER